MLNTITYKGVEYPTREIDVNVDGERHHYTVSTTELNSAIYNDETGYPDAEAQAIDESIFYYLDEEEWKMSDKELSEYLSKNV